MTNKNLLVICNNFPDKENMYIGGIFIKEQIKQLKSFFDNIYVISPVPYGIEYFRKIKQEDYILENIHVYFLKYLNFPLFYSYRRNNWIYLEKRAIIKHILKKEIKFDLIHAHYTWPSGAVAIELQKKFNVPVVITEHTSVTFKNAIGTKDPIFIKSWKSCDAIIRIRMGDIKLFESVGISLNKVHYIPNGFDNNTFMGLDGLQCKEKLNLPINNKKILLNVGNMYDKIKGHKFLIEAINEVKKRRKDILCIIIGTGKLKNNLEKQIRSMGLENEIKLVGGKTHDESPIWINACNIFILPSLNEGNPTVLPECLACGKPFIGTSVGGIPEIITSEDYGLLCEPANSEYLAQNILTALDKVWDEEKIRRYAQSFSWQNIANEILKVYEIAKRDFIEK
ncbi:MAG: glycosyltransferase family 4 protein [Candidatus Methanoperedens sp.]